MGSASLRSPCLLPSILCSPWAAGTSMAGKAWVAGSLREIPAPRRFWGFKEGFGETRRVCQRGETPQRRPSLALVTGHWGEDRQRLGKGWLEKCVKDGASGRGQGTVGDEETSEGEREGGMGRHSPRQQADEHRLMWLCFHTGNMWLSHGFLLGHSQPLCPCSPWDSCITSPSPLLTLTHSPCCWPGPLCNLPCPSCSLSLWGLCTLGAECSTTAECLL